MQARELQPPIFMAQEPQMPSLHDLLKVRVGSISLLILIKASSTMGPQLPLHNRFRLMNRKIKFAIATTYVFKSTS